MNCWLPHGQTDYPYQVALLIRRRPGLRDHYSNA